MYGVSREDPECIHTVDEAVEYINKVGFLPLFKNEIPGFSLEERTAPEYWWSGDAKSDPWEWREIIARSGKVAYGKFFDKKAGFISKQWFPYFANFRRDGYDFDALWDDEKASIRQKKIMDFYLEENAVLSFTDNPEDYLPAVMTSWEGLECYNYSPLLYAFECENVAISGKGTLQPKMGTWKGWFKRPKPHLEALKELYTKASTNVPVIERQMATGENHLRPHLIHFNRCKNVMLDGFKIRESPFWTIHLYMCDGGIVRNLDVRAHGHNNDGIDFEMSRNFLVEDCSFDQGDDAVVIKAGRNQDAWRLNTPCENIVIRHCQILKGHTLLGIGSEISGGIRNIYMHDCTAPNSVMRLFFVKTNHRRGGFIENIYMKNVASGTAQRVLEIDTEVLYQWKDLVPTYEKRITRIDGIYMDKVTCESADAVYELKGNAELPVKNVRIKDVKVGSVKKFVKKVSNVENVVEKNVTYSQKD